MEFSAEDQEQIDQIKDALKEEEVSGWVEEDYTETAISLFKSGIRSVK